MSETTIPTFDIKRATGILKVAKKQKMYLDPLPDSDEKVIMEAERIVQLALQADRVAREAGQENVPNHEAVLAVLFEAQVNVGSDLVKVTVDGTEADWRWDDVFKHVLDNGNSNLEFADEKDAEKLNAERAKRNGESQGGTSGVTSPDSNESVGTAAGVGGEESSSVPTGTGSSSSSPKPEESWVDADGQIWIVDQPLPSGIEAHLDGTKEKTILPPDFLTRQVDHQPDPVPQQDESTPEETPEPEPTPVPAATTTTAATTQVDPVASTASAPHPSSNSDPAYHDLLARVKADYERSGLPLPPDVQTPPEMPEDLTNTPDIQARKLHSQFNSCSARARYLLGLERQSKIGCQRLRKNYMKGAMVRARAELGSGASVTEVTQVAEDDGQVKVWREREDLHADRESTLEDLFEVYVENVKVLSRDYTMRDQESKGS